MRFVLCSVLALALLASAGCGGGAAPSTPPAATASSSGPPAPGAPPPPGASPVPTASAAGSAPSAPGTLPAPGAAPVPGAAVNLLQPEEQRQTFGAWTMRLPAAFAVNTKVTQMGQEFGLNMGRVWVRDIPEKPNDGISLAVIDTPPAGLTPEAFVDSMRKMLPIPEKLTEVQMPMADGRTVMVKTASAAGPLRNPRNPEAPTIPGQVDVFVVTEGGKALTLIWTSSGELAAKENFAAAVQEATKSLKFSGAVAQVAPGGIDPVTGLPMAPGATNLAVGGPVPPGGASPGALPAVPAPGEARIDPVTGRPVFSGAVVTPNPAPGAVPGVAGSGESRIDPVTGRPVFPGVGNPPAGTVANNGGLRSEPAVGAPVPGAEGGAPPAVAADDYAALATQAQRDGHENDGLRYLMALSLVKPDDADARKNMMLAPALKRSALGVRFGVGVFFSAPRGFAGNPQQVVGVTTGPNVPAPKGQARGGGGLAGLNPGGAVVMPNLGGPQAGNPAGAPQGPPAGAPDQLQQSYAFFTGEIGQKVAEGLASRVADGTFGLALKQAAELKGTGGAAGQPQQPPGGVPGQPGVPPQVMPVNGGLRGGESPNMTLFPGVTALGLGDAKELQEKAQREGIDVLIMFTVVVKPVSKGGFNTTTTFKAFDVARRAELFTSREVSTLAIAALHDPKSKVKEAISPVDVAAEKFFEYVDGNLKMSELPLTVTADAIAKRAAQITATKTEDPLPALAELQFYHTRKLLDDATRASAFKTLAGDPGQMLASGDPEKVKQAVAEWLPKQGGGGRRTLPSR